MFIADWSFQDPMTGLLNKKHAWPRFEAALQSTHVSDRPFSIMLVDIDNLKRFCDERGKASGDKAIKVVANVLAEYWTQDFLPCRYGGEEFAVAILGLDSQQSVTLAENIRATMAHKKFPDYETSESVSITVSIGLACARNQETFSVLENARIRCQEGADFGFYFS